MIIAIDETGDFNPISNKINLFVGVHIRQEAKFYNKKIEQFNKWESSVPNNLKDHKGEIKSSKLSDEFLYTFTKDVVATEPQIGITPVGIVPNQNPKHINEKHKSIQLAGINNGVLEYQKLGKPELAHTYKQFANWFRKISFTQYYKITLLGKCVFNCLRDSIIHSILNGYDHELVDLKYKIDQIFLKGLEQNSFWHELMRNQLLQFSEKEPLPCIVEWEKEKHPFYQKYHSKGYYVMNDLFIKNLNFVKSHNNFEVRIADTVCTIIHRFWNEEQNKNLYHIIKYFFNADGHIPCLLLNDFDFNYKIGQLGDNPWDSFPIFTKEG